LDPITVKEISQPPIVRASMLRRLGQAPSVAVNHALAQRLAFVHRVRHRLYVRKNATQHPAPPVDDRTAQRHQLGDNGVVRMGAIVRRHDILIDVPSEGTVVFEGATAGEVKRIKYKRTNLPRAIAERISVLVEWPGPLRVGDWLWTDADDGPRRVGVVEEIVDDGSREPRLYVCGDLPRRAELEVYRRAPTAEQSVQARDIGPYSQVTQRPLSGQAMREDHFVYLARRGCRALLADFAGYKSDDTEARRWALAALSGSGALSDVWTERRRRSPTATELPTGSLRYLDALAAVAGVRIALDPEHAALRLHLALPARDTARWSSGEVSKPETVNYNTLAPEPDGLHCEKIFGPVRDLVCACGRYDHRAGKWDGPPPGEQPPRSCEVCGVPLCTSDTRRQRFGHVALPVPVVPRHLRPLLGQLLGERVDGLVEEMADDGGKALLARLEQPQLGAGARGPLGEAVRAGRLGARDLVWTVVPVLPADLRPIVPLPGGRFATSDLNDLYRRLIHRSNRLRHLAELQAPQEALAREHRELQRAVDQLLLNDTLPDPFRYEGKKLLGIFALLREVLRHPKDRRVDYSGCAPAIVSVQPTRQCTVYYGILLEIMRPLLLGKAAQKGLSGQLDKPEAQRQLLEEALAQRPLVFAHAERGGGVGAARVALGADPVIRLDPQLAACIGATTGDKVAVHLPLSEAAIEEARWLCEAPDGARHPADRAADASGWIQTLCETRESFAEELVRLALLEPMDPCRWPPAAVLLGGNASP